MATLEVELLGRGMVVAAEMELLKNLPCHDRANFSKFNQSSWKTHSRPYICLKNGTENRAIEIVSDQRSLMLRDLERDAAKTCRVPFKRASAVEDNSRKVPRLDQEAESLSFSSDHPYPRSPTSPAHPQFSPTYDNSAHLSLHRL